MSEVIKLVCKTCGKNYTKPFLYKEYNEIKPNIFFKWSLEYCDDCRKNKENEALNSLPKVLNLLSKDKM